MKVLKFGGTSVANAERFLRVAKIMEDNAEHEQIATVLSAPAKITNYLIALITQTVAQQDTTSELNAIRQIFNQLLDGLQQALPNFELPRLQQYLFDELIDLEKILTGVRLLGQCPESVNANIICRGERWSVRVMQALLIAKGFKVTVLDPVTTLVARGPILESSVDIVQSTQRLQQNAIPQHHIILMAGFTAGNQQQQLVALGRNGSDYSASVLAACLGADACEIWTDVDGIYTCDPNQVPEAQLLSSLSYQEAMELSYFGASVLHPRTIAPIAQFQIPCRIKNTANPQAAGTLIAQHSGKGDLPVKGITKLDEMAMFSVSGPGMKGMVGMVARVFQAMSRRGISVVLITQSSSEYSISFCVPQAEIQSATAALEEEFHLELQAGLLEPIAVVEQLAIISVIGDGMRTLPGVSARFFAALAQANISIVAIAQGSSERSISAVINQQSAPLGIKAVHQMLFATSQVLEVFIIGTGGVGQALLQQLQRQQAWLKNKHIDLRVCAIANSSQFISDVQGLNLENWQQDLQQSTQTMTIDAFLASTKNYSLVNPVIVDCTSSQQIAQNYITFLQAGYHVVTPNKKANTGDMHFYQQLRGVAAGCRRKFLYDTNVGAGLPVIENLQNLLNAGDELISFSGILSGSLSYIFGKLEEGMPLSEATRQARDLGYTEPDPRDDLSGEDVARKLLILAREAGLSLELSEIEIEALLPEVFQHISDTETFISRLSELDATFAERVSAAAAEQKVLRYMGTINEQGRCQVRIVAVDQDNPLYKIKNGENALAFYSRYYQPIPLVLRGYGAGNDVTAAGVFADLLRTVSWKLGV
jgi:bifunctional aspartokinase / homoserine dehydrogenase 1